MKLIISSIFSVFILSCGMSTNHKNETPEKPGSLVVDLSSMDSLFKEDQTLYNSIYTNKEITVTGYCNEKGEFVLPIQRIPDNFGNVTPKPFGIHTSLTDSNFKSSGVLKSLSYPVFYDKELKTVMDGDHPSINCYPLLQTIYLLENSLEQYSLTAKIPNDDMTSYLTPVEIKQRNMGLLKDKLSQLKNEYPEMYNKVTGGRMIGLYQSDYKLTDRCIIDSVTITGRLVETQLNKGGFIMISLKDCKIINKKRNFNFDTLTSFIPSVKPDESIPITDTTIIH